MTGPQTDTSSLDGDGATAPAKRDAGLMEPWFVYAVGGLLLIIIAALTGLAVKYYRQASAAKAQLAETEKQANAASAMLAKMLGHGGMGGMVPGMGHPPIAGAPGTLAGLRREELLPVDATLDGKPVHLLTITAFRARQVGLQPGDVVYVRPVPMTQPATAPADGD